MVRDQRREHPSVMVRVQDALDDHMKSAVKGEPGGEVDQVDVRAAGYVPLPEHLPAEVVLAHDRQAAAVPAAYLGRDGRLSRRGIAADHDQPGGGCPVGVTQRVSSVRSTIDHRIDTVAAGCLSSARH
jgi:hypothetical protein